MLRSRRCRCHLHLSLQIWSLGQATLVPFHHLTHHVPGSSIHGTPTGAFEKSKSGSASISSLSQCLPPPARNMAGLTRSQSLFSIFTGVDARALAVNGSDKFFLFMDLRAEQRWVSYIQHELPKMACCNKRVQFSTGGAQRIKEHRAHPKTPSDAHGTAWKCGNEDRDTDRVQQPYMWVHLPFASDCPVASRVPDTS